MMQFLPELKEFLSENGFIYTVRGYDMTHKWVEVEGVGWCERIPLGMVGDLEDIRQFVENSGFDSLDAWVDKIRTSIPQAKQAWLYKVVVKERI